MNRGVRSLTITLFKRGTLLFICTSLILYFLAILLWIPGIPGVENTYAKGWFLGFKTLNDYFLGSCIILIIYLNTSRIFKKISIVTHPQIIVASVFWMFFSYSAFNMYRAFQLMITK